MPKEVEYVAAALAVLYLLLAIKQWRSCWVAAFVSSCLYVLVLFQARLYMESALNAFYAAMSIYGFWCWRTGASAEQGSGVHRWPLRWHLLGLLAVLVLAAVSSWFLRRYTSAAWPYADSFVTWSSVFATFLVARKVFENWHWWLIIDALTMFLSYTRGLYTTALLFALYLAMIIVGMREWRRDLEPVNA
jgi:nicotinamide mononucleotide transporter